MIDATKVFFTKTKNYQKIALKGSGLINVLVSPPSPSPTVYYGVTIPHGLGKVTSCRVWYDPGSGRRFPLSIEQYSDDGATPSPCDQVSGRAYLTTSGLTIEFKNYSGSTKAVTYYYRIYYDS